MENSLSVERFSLPIGCFFQQGKRMARVFGKAVALPCQDQVAFGSAAWYNMTILHAPSMQLTL